MFKKLVSCLCFTVFLIHICYANEIAVNIVPDKKISTSDVSLKQGDTVEFIILKDIYLNNKKYINKGEKVIGVITSLEDNGFLLKEASLFAENFKVKNVYGQTIELDGVIYRKGTDYWMIMQFMPVFSAFMRGGEAHIRPKKDSFTLYLKDEK